MFWKKCFTIKITGWKVISNHPLDLTTLLTYIYIHVHVWWVEFFQWRYTLSNASIVTDWLTLLQNLELWIFFVVGYLEYFFKWSNVEFKEWTFFWIYILNSFILTLTKWNNFLSRKALSFIKTLQAVVIDIFILLVNKLSN